MYCYRARINIMYGESIITITHAPDNRVSYMRSHWFTKRIWAASVRHLPCLAHTAFPMQYTLNHDILGNNFVDLATNWGASLSRWKCRGETCDFGADA